jgi:HEPN domain-containing protein
MDEKILNRIGELIGKGENVKNNVIHPGQDHYHSSVNPGLFQEWKTGAISFMETITENDSVYRKNFLENTRGNMVLNVEEGIGILKALKEDIEHGYLTKHRTLVAVEVFDDFLEMAEYLLESGYKDPAASLIGAVLENGLREMCRNSKIEVKKGDDISSLNQKLGSKGIYTKIMQKQIQAWKGIRDSANHGKFDEYNKEDVQDMLKGVKRFLGEYLK